MKSARAKRTKITPCVFLNYSAKLFRQPRGLEPRERQMRRKGPLFARDAQFFRSSVDIGRESLQIRRRHNARPEDPRMFFVGKETESTKIQSDEVLTPHAGKCPANACELCFWHFTDEFQRYVQIFQPHPAGLRRDRAKGLLQAGEVFPNRGGNLQRDE